MGAEWTAGTALAMESWPARSRKIASGLLQAGWPIGYLLAATVSLLEPTIGWRAMFLIAAVPALLVIPIRYMVPDEMSKPIKNAAPPRAADLSAPGVRKMIVLGSLVMGFGFLVYYGLTASYMGLALKELHIAPATAKGYVMLFNVGMLIGVIGAGWFANRFGVIAALVTPALLMVPALPLYVGVAPALLPLGAFLGGMLGVGYSGVTPVLTTSLFATHVRARCIAIVYHVGALIGAIAPTLIASLAEDTPLKLSSAIAIVVGTALILMSTAVLVLRRYLTQPAGEAQTPSPSDRGLARLDVQAA